MPRVVNNLAGIWDRIKAVFTAPSASEDGVKESYDQLRAEVGQLREVMNGLEAQFGELAKLLRKQDSRQKEISIQLDDLSEWMQEGGQEAQAQTQPLVQGLIALADQIENLYLFAQNDQESPLWAQAEMMWRATIKSLSDAGVTVITGQGMALDFNLHVTKSALYAEGVPPGYVLQTLASGYIQNDKVVRRAAVIVSKKEEETT